MVHRLLKYIKDVKIKSVLTAERPTQLTGDVLARYRFASRRCKGKNVLDIGTGLGLGANYIAHSGAKHVLGIDYNKQTIDLISKTNTDRKVSFKHLDASDIKKIKKKFDVVIAFEILEHLSLDKIEKFIKSVSSILMPGGLLLLTTPNGLKTEIIFGKPYNPYHIKEYTGGELLNLLKPYFFKVTIRGLEHKNRDYLRIQNKIRKSFLYKVIYLLGHFKAVRELAPYIPKIVREKITKENILPVYRQSDFVLNANYKNSPGLFVYATKHPYQ